jgi:hypothetical protein
MKEFNDFLDEFKKLLKKYQVELRVNESIRNWSNLFQLEIKINGKKVKKIGIDELELVEIAYLLKKFGGE